MLPPPDSARAMAYSHTELVSLRRRVDALATTLDRVGRDLEAASRATFAACGSDDYGATHRRSQEPTLEAAAGLLRLLSLELESRAGELTVAQVNYETVDSPTPRSGG